MNHLPDAPVERKRPWAWEVLVYVLGSALTVLGLFVWFVRANVQGDWSLRLSQLWDSIGLISLGLAIVAIGLTLTILRVQNHEAERAEQETKARQEQHAEVLRRVEDIAARTHVTVSETGEDVKGMKHLLGTQIESARAATRSDSVMTADVEAEVLEGDELDQVSLEGIRGGDISNLPLDTHALPGDKLSERVETAEGIFYPMGAVPVGVIADLVAGWEAHDPESDARWRPKSKANWTAAQLVGAYRSYSPGALAQGRRNLSGAPWFVTFRRPDMTLETFYVSRTGRTGRGRTERTPLIKRLKGVGADAVWVPLAEFSKED